MSIKSFIEKIKNIVLFSKKEDNLRFDSLTTEDFPEYDYESPNNVVVQYVAPEPKKKTKKKAKTSEVKKPVVKKPKAKKSDVKEQVKVDTKSVKTKAKTQKKV